MSLTIHRYQYCLELGRVRKYGTLPYVSRLSVPPPLQGSWYCSRLSGNQLPYYGHTQLEIFKLQHSQLTLIRLIAVVGKVLGTATNQTKLAKLTTGLEAQGSKTGRAALSSWRWHPNVRMVDCEGVARLLRGTA